MHVLYLYLHIYIYIYMNTHICIYTYIHRCPYTYIYIHLCVFVYINVEMNRTNIYTSVRHCSFGDHSIQPKGSGFGAKVYAFARIGSACECAGASGHLWALAGAI